MWPIVRGDIWYRKCHHHCHFIRNVTPALSIKFNAMHQMYAQKFEIPTVINCYDTKYGQKAVVTQEEHLWIYGFSTHCIQLVSVLHGYMYAYERLQSLNSIVAFFPSSANCLYCKHTYRTKRTRVYAHTCWNARKASDSVHLRWLHHWKLSTTDRGTVALALCHQKGSQSKAIGVEC